MTMVVPFIETYPKTVLLGDRSKVVLRPLEEGDKMRLLTFFKGISEEERYYLKENVTSPEVLLSWTSLIDFDRVIPIVALDGDQIVGDATLHRSRAQARRHVGEIRVVVAEAYREIGLGRRLIRELLDIASELRLYHVFVEFVVHREEAAIHAVRSMGFREVATLKGRIRDLWGNYEDLMILELPLGEHEAAWRY